MKRIRSAGSARSAAAEIPPGPNAGRSWSELPVVRRDPISGRNVAQLTHYRGHSHHCVGAEPCWLDGGRRLAIVSDREGWGNLFLYDFAARTLSQLTDLRGPARPHDARMLTASRLGFRYGVGFFELELTTLRIRRRPRSMSRVKIAASAAWRTGVARLDEGRHAIWVGRCGGAACHRRVVAVASASGRTPLAAIFPCVRPGTKEVLFVSDSAGYAQIHAVEIARSGSLPRLVDVRH